ncbi:MAG: hypothetical protein ACKVS9_11685 [Phycisphaerae bacterium]
MRKQRTFVHSVALASALAALLLVAGCGPRPTGDVPPPPPITMTTPQATIESFVANVRYEQTLIAARQRAAAAQAALDGKRLLAADQLTAAAARQVKDNPMYESIFGEDALLAFRNNWAAMMLHDLATLNLNELRVILSPDNSRQVRYHLPSAGGIYTFELVNLGDRWAISLITPEAIKEVKPFVAAPSSTAPQSAPASSSASTPAP